MERDFMQVMVLSMSVVKNLLFLSLAKYFSLLT